MLSQKVVQELPLPNRLPVTYIAASFPAAMSSTVRTLVPAAYPVPFSRTCEVP